MFKKLLKKRLLLLTTIVSFFLISITAVAQEKLTESSKVIINGIGSIRVEMTPKQATQAGGIPIILNGSLDPACSYYQPKSQLKDVWFMVVDDQIARVDIRNPQVTTRSGTKIGDTEAKIKSLYPGQIEVTPHKYNPQGHYLTFIPKDEADKQYRVVFETDGKRVIQYRSGRLPEVAWVEGCS